MEIVRANTGFGKEKARKSPYWEKGGVRFICWNNKKISFSNFYMRNSKDEIVKIIQFPLKIERNFFSSNDRKGWNISRNKILFNA